MLRSTLCLLVSALPSGGVVARLTLFFDPAPCGVPNALRPLCAVERSPPPGAPFAPTSFSSSSLPYVLDCIWLFFAVLPSSLALPFFWPFASLVALFLVVSASPPGGIVALSTLSFDSSAPCVPDASRPLCAVERSPSPGAPFVPPLGLSSSLSPSALDLLWLFFGVLPSSLAPRFFCPFASMVFD
jgi:hypothetical protein